MQKIIEHILALSKLVEKSKQREETIKKLVYYIVCGSEYEREMDLQKQVKVTERIKQRLKHKINELSSIAYNDLRN